MSNIASTAFHRAGSATNVGHTYVQQHPRLAAFFTSAKRLPLSKLDETMCFSVAAVKVAASYVKFRQPDLYSHRAPAVC
jgi:hypothetical protein